MNQSEEKCERCGWWDMAIRYGSPKRCARCGHVLVSHLSARSPASDEAGKTADDRVETRDSNVA